MTSKFSIHHHLILLTLTSSFLSQPTLAQSCNAIQNFNNYNATNTHAIPALHLEGVRSVPNSYHLVTDPSKPWYITARHSGATQIQNGTTFLWANTGDANTTEIGMCTESTPSFAWPGEYAFGKDVLERSVHDEGDCKVMLGEECVGALQEQYKEQGVRDMMRGRCHDGGVGEWNLSIPWECVGLVGGGERWLGGMFASGSQLNATRAAETFSHDGCDNDTRPLNASMFGGSGIAGSYDEAIRFPSVYFVTFWPNRTGQNVFETSWVEDVHVHVLCLRPDDIMEGSAVPPSAEELLGADGVRYHRNLTTDGGKGGKEGKAVGRSVPLVFGAVVLMAMLLV